MPWTHRNRKGQSVARITPLSARMELAGFGYAPLEEYPGITTAKWKARHLECGNEVSIRLHVLRQGRGCCMPCGAKKHGSTRSLDPGKAFEAMLSANLEPLEPYPGSVGKAWKSRCLVCGDIVAPGTRTLRLAREAVERVARGNVQRLAGGTKKGQSGSCFP